MRCIIHVIQIGVPRCFFKEIQGVWCCFEQQKHFEMALGDESAIMVILGECDQ